VTWAKVNKLIMCPEIFLLCLLGIDIQASAQIVAADLQLSSVVISLQI
jgi:glutamine phosphoribosylpyrophosphate amidotransferase